MVFDNVYIVLGCKVQRKRIFKIFFFNFVIYEFFYEWGELLTNVNILVFLLTNLEKTNVLF